MLAADAHAHVFEEACVLHGRSVRYPAATLIHEMDRNGVDLALVIARPSAQVRLDDLVYLHDRLAADTQQHRDRLPLAAWGSPRLGRDGLRELERTVSTLGFRAIKLHPEQEQFVLDDVSAQRCVEVAAEYGVPVIAHTALAVHGAEPWRLARVAARHPAVTFVMAHLGADGGMLQSLSAVEIAAEVDNIMVDGSATVTDPTATYLEPARMLGAERVLYGSNEPIHQMALSLLKLDLVELPLDQRELVAGANLVRLLGLPTPPSSLAPHASMTSA
jgi:predicted TIM-barrel fold metal-dependent hydrolase